MNGADSTPGKEKKPRDVTDVLTRKLGWAENP